MVGFFCYCFTLLSFFVFVLLFIKFSMSGGEKLSELIGSLRGNLFDMRVKKL